MQRTPYNTPISLDARRAARRERIFCFDLVELTSVDSLDRQHTTVITIRGELAGSVGLGRSAADDEEVPVP